MVFDFLCTQFNIFHTDKISFLTFVDPRDPRIKNFNARTFCVVLGTNCLEILKAYVTVVLCRLD
jgi:hypothetical protein